ncbi:MAG: hypothetical protein AAGI69_12555 [Cyanobacteria bacterium P01_H01_bin.21]
MLSSLFAQFRHQYADGSLTTELLMTHAENYLVKATVSIGEKVVITALAADTSLTTADDQAKARALAMLGFGQATGQKDRATGQDPAPNKSLDNSAAVPAAASSPEPSALIDSSPISDIGPMLAPEIADSDDIGRPIDSITPDEAPAPSEVPASSLAATAIENFDDTNPVDLSDIIAQTDVEMARLGWSSLQGRTYLEKTFDKRSRQQLTDEELLTFLLYLESQPTPSMG